MARRQLPVLAERDDSVHGVLPAQQLGAAVPACWPTWGV